MDLGIEFREAIVRARRALSQVTEESGAAPFRPGGWLRVELLGHMIDSCLYNHVRFLTAANHRSLQVNRYDQTGSVRLHGYAELTWPEVFDHWCIQQELLARLVERIPQDAFAVECKLEDGSTMRLDELIRDYLRHLEHHLRQMMDSCPA